MGYRVQLANTGQSFDVDPGETVLAAALRTNIGLAHDCQLGGCGTCRIKLLQGQVRYAEFPFALTPDEERIGYALACQAEPQSDLLITPARRQTELPPAVRCSAVIESIRPLSPLVVGLRLRLVDTDEMSYLPGQHMNVILPDGTSRSFSMASRPNGNHVDFHIRRLIGGSFTEALLPRLQCGHELVVELPLGAFHFRAQDRRPLLMVATGTGLAPIKAMIESMMDDPDCPPVSLYWGARTRDDLYMHDEILGWGKRLYEFNYVPVLSRVHSGWEGRAGYVQDAVVAHFDTLSQHAIYLCGSPLMISSAKRLFVTCGASLDFIYTEAFTNSKLDQVAV